LESFIQDFVGSRIEGFDPAIIASADQDGDPAPDVSFVAPLPKCHFFHALGHMPPFADFTNGGFSGGHRPVPSPLPGPATLRDTFRGNV
jgi:hypothetical protein